MTNYFKHKIRTKKPATIVAWVVFGITAAIAFIILFGFVFMWLWNWLMPAIFGLVTITYWQAVGLIILFKILFGGFGSGKGHHKSSKKKYQCDDRNTKSEFSKWKHYDKFWQEEGNEAFEIYVSHTEQPTKDDSANQ